MSEINLAHPYVRQRCLSVNWILLYLHCVL